MLTVNEYFNKSADDLRRIWDSKISTEENVLFRYLDDVKENQQVILKSRSS